MVWWQVGYKRTEKHNSIKWNLLLTALTKGMPKQLLSRSRWFFLGFSSSVYWNAANRWMTGSFKGNNQHLAGHDFSSVAVKGNQWCQAEEWKSCNNHHESRCKCWSSSLLSLLSLLLLLSSSSSPSWIRSRFWDQAALAKANDKVGVQSHGFAALLLLPI